MIVSRFGVSGLSGELFLRRMQSNDILDVFILSNQPHVRENSLNSKPITWLEHVNWFQNVISDPGNVMFAIVNEKDQFLGQIRFRLDGDQAVVSISLDASIRGKGYGSTLLSRSIKELLTQRQEIKKVKASILSGNVPSIKLFEGIGFRLMENHDGLLTYYYTREE